MIGFAGTLKLKIQSLLFIYLFISSLSESSQTVEKELKL